VILLTSLGLLGVAIVRDSFTFTQSYWSERASQGAAYDMRNAIFTRLEHLSFSYHDKAQTGQLMTRVTNDVETVRAFTGNGILQLLNAVVMLIGSATILLITNWKLALVALLIIPAILGVFLFFIFEIIDAPIEVKDKPDAVILPPTQGSVIFEDVSFRYA